MTGTDRVKWALGAVAVAVTLAGCGSSSAPDRQAIKAALTRSPLSYFHYEAPAWTGTRLQPQLGRVKSSGNFAVAHVSIPVGPPVNRSQWTLLARHASTWRVVDSVTGPAKWLPCSAPRDVMQTLAGGCSKIPTNEGGGLVGPVEARMPTRAEFREIVAAAAPRGNDSCVTYNITISKIDAAYARFGSVFHKPYGKCFLYDGEAVVMHTSRGWNVIDEASSGFPCEDAPPGVIRSLFGGCRTLRG